MTNYFKKYIAQTQSAAPLAVFRIAFGFLMLISTIRFAAKGWISKLYIEPQYFFSYWGFEWMKPLEGIGMYIIFALIGLCCILILIGLFYRVAAVSFFLLFSYVELLDKTNYLNHYYFISILAFIMIWLPAHRYFSVDAWLKPSLLQKNIPRWTVDILKLQVGMVYFYAGVAKINPDWLLHAHPLKIWLPAKSNLPLIGRLFDYEITAYLFSWFGVLYDISIPFLLLLKKTRKYAFAAVIIFHLLTWLLFPIGMFPFIMISAALIFFSPAFHQKILDKISAILPKAKPVNFSKTYQTSQPVLIILSLFIVIQMLLPWRYLLYPGKLFWHEQGYRFSWRVMLMEKAGYATFTVKDKVTGQYQIVSPYEYLTPAQEKMMATQPDMILQFSKFLQKEFEKKGYQQAEVYAKVYATLNGSGSRLLIDPEVNLAAQSYSIGHKPWILSFENKRL